MLDDRYTMLGFHFTCRHYSVDKHTTGLGRMVGQDAKLVLDNSSHPTALSYIRSIHYVKDKIAMALRSLIDLVVEEGLTHFSRILKQNTIC